MELSAITDSSWLRHVNTFKPVETFAIDDFLFEFYVIDEIGYPVNYLYRLLCYKEGYEEPILSLNTEFGPAYIYFHAAIVGTKHINLGMSNKTETLEQFRAWALEQLPELLPTIEKSKLLYFQTKGIQLLELKNISEFEAKRMKKNMCQLVELSNEFMFPFHFEEPKEMFETSTISVLNVKLLIMETREGRNVGAILFPKKDFTEEEITKWLFCYGVHYEPYKGSPITVERCSNILFSYLQHGYVLVVYLKGKEQKQVQHIYDMSRNHDETNDLIFGDLDLRRDRQIYVDNQQVLKDETIELNGEVNVVFVNGMTLYGDRVVIKDYTVSIMKREQNIVIAQIEHFCEMQIEIGHLEYNPKAELQMKCCYIEYERTT